MSDTDTLDCPNPFELIDSVFSPYPMERWRAHGMTMGLAAGLSALHEVYQAVRNDSAEAEARVNEMEAREALVQHLCDQIAAMQERINALADALEARHKADAERAARDAFEQEPLSLPPGDPPGADPAIAADLNGGAHIPGGELHDVPAKSELPEPPLEADQGGDLPEELEDLPEPPEPPKGQVYPQPIAISLNEE